MVGTGSEVTGVAEDSQPCARGTPEAWVPSRPRHGTPPGAGTPGSLQPPWGKRGQGQQRPPFPSSARCTGSLVVLACLLAAGRPEGDSQALWVISVAETGSSGHLTVGGSLPTVWPTPDRELLWSRLSYFYFSLWEPRFQGKHQGHCLMSREQRNGAVGESDHLIWATPPPGLESQCDRGQSPWRLCGATL